MDPLIRPRVFKKLKRVNRVAFRVWLARFQSEVIVGRADATFPCPLEVFTGRRFYEIDSRRKESLWINTFAKRIDDLGLEEVCAAHALAILDRMLREE
jgi:hypothetical protein